MSAVLRACEGVRLFFWGSGEAEPWAYRAMMLVYALNAAGLSDLADPA